MNSVTAGSDLQLETLPSNLMELPGSTLPHLIAEAEAKFATMLGRIDAGADKVLAAEMELLRRADIFRSIFAFMLGLVARIPDFAESKGCDIGCGIGLRTAFAAFFGPAQVTGLDGNARFIASAQLWLGQAKLPGWAFHTYEKPLLPFGRGELDWVMMRGVYSTMSGEMAQSFFKDAARALKPDGLLLLFDSANPLHAASVERIKAYHKRMEIGDGTASAPDGPIYKTRLHLLKQAFADDLDEAQAQRLARATCYMSEAEVLKAGKGFVSRKKMPDSKFDGRDIAPAPVWPKTGAPAFRPSDPLAIRNELRRAGFSVGFHRHYLGADLAESELKEYFKSNGAFYITAKKLKSAASRPRK
jgi:SAM-dependent methyltransferase